MIKNVCVRKLSIVALLFLAVFHINSVNAGNKDFEGQTESNPSGHVIYLDKDGKVKGASKRGKKIGQFFLGLAKKVFVSLPVGMYKFVRKSFIDKVLRSSKLLATTGLITALKLISNSLLQPTVIEGSLMCTPSVFSQTIGFLPCIPAIAALTPIITKGAVIFAVVAGTYVIGTLVIDATTGTYNFIAEKKAYYFSKKEIVVANGEVQTDPTMQQEREEDDEQAEEEEEQQDSSQVQTQQTEATESTESEEEAPQEEQSEKQVDESTEIEKK